MPAAPAEDARFIPALRFNVLTPLFDSVATVAVRDRTIKRLVLEHAAIQPGEDVLDVGCGTGTLALTAARSAPNANYIGLDADPAILDRARKKAAAAGVDISFDQGMSNALPYEDDSFDVVLSTLFFHHLPDDSKHGTARELRRVLRPAGRLVVADPGRPQDPLMRVAVLATVQMLDGFPTTRLNVRGELPDVLAGAGFSDVSLRHRMRTPTGTYDVMTARSSATV